MDECRLTLKQIQALASGQKVRVSYSTLGEYGRIDHHEIELVPEQEVIPNGRDPDEVAMGNPRISQ